MSSVKGRNGGARVGAGRPKEVGSVRWKREQRKAKGQPPPAAPAPVAVPKPKGLPAGQSAVWDMLAPLALEQRTLTDATAFALVELCEAIVLKRDIARILEADGLTTTAVKTRMEQDGSGEQVGETKAHPLIAKWTALLVRVEAGLMRFRLAPMGKEIPPVEKPADEWSEFDQPLTLVKGAK